MEAEIKLAPSRDAVDSLLGACDGCVRPQTVGIVCVAPGDGRTDVGFYREKVASVSWD